MAPLHWQMLLPITFLWPILFVYGGANSLRCGLLQMSSICPFIFWEALPMHSDGPIALAMLLPITLLVPIRFLGGTPDAFGWSHCIGGYCCQLLHFGPLLFLKVLLMHADALIPLADAAYNGLTMAPHTSC